MLEASKKKSWMKYNLKKLIQPSQLSLYSQKKNTQNKITHKMYKFLLSISTTFSRELQFLWVFDESPRQFSQSRLGSNAQSTGARGQRRFLFSSFRVLFSSSFLSFSVRFITVQSRSCCCCHSMWSSPLPVERYMCLREKLTIVKVGSKPAWLS